MPAGLSALTSPYPRSSARMTTTFGLRGASAATAPAAESLTVLPPEPVGAAELAAHLAARLCHDFISPAGAIMSGLDLLNDPEAQDMRDDALRLIAASSEKLSPPSDTTSMVS